MDYQIVKAFSKNGKGGNAAAVLINSNLSDNQKQEAARRIGFSETAFLDHRASQLHISFFTPEKQIPYCGHATIAAVNVLRKERIIGTGEYLLQTALDPITVHIGENAAFMQQAFPAFTACKEDPAALLNLSSGDISSRVFADNGVRFLLVELSDEKILFNLRPNQALIHQFSERNQLIGLYVFVRQNDRIKSRMFAPYYGIPEENATGMAAGLLGGWLFQQAGGSTGDSVNFTIEQGASETNDELGYLQVRVERRNGLLIVLTGGEASITGSAQLALP